MIATHYHNNVPTNDQVQQSAALFRLISAQDQTAFDALQSITTPAPMLIQNPGTNTVRFIMGTAKFLADPIRHPTGHPLQSSFLAILGEDLVEQADTPRAIILLDDVLKTNMVKIPTAPQFSAKHTQKAAELPDGGGTAGAQFNTSQWFKHSPVMLAQSCAHLLNCAQCHHFWLMMHFWTMLRRTLYGNALHFTKTSTHRRLNSSEELNIFCKGCTLNTSQLNVPSRYQGILSNVVSNTTNQQQHLPNAKSRQGAKNHPFRARTR